LSQKKYLDGDWLTNYGLIQILLLTLLVGFFTKFPYLGLICNSTWFFGFLLAMSMVYVSQMFYILFYINH